MYMFFLSEVVDSDLECLIAGIQSEMSGQDKFPRCISRFLLAMKQQTMTVIRARACVKLKP